jgi:hypothetical protein
MFSITDFTTLILEVPSGWGPEFADLAEETRTMSNHRSFRDRAAWYAPIFLGALVLASACPTASGQSPPVSLVVSNKLPNGPNYSKVTLTQTAPNTVSFQVTADKSLYTTTGVKFGIASFGFESVATLNASEITFDSPTTGWLVKQQNGSDPGFGQFDWLLKSNNLASQGSQTLAFHVTHPGLTISNFTTKVNAQNADFAAFIINFTVSSSPGVTSQCVANNGAHALKAALFPVVGAVSAAILLLAGGGLILQKRRRARAARLEGTRHLPSDGLETPGGPGAAPAHRAPASARREGSRPEGSPVP